jgi:hypothetical protein
MRHAIAAAAGIVFSAQLLSAQAPHQMLLGPGERITYFVVKVAVPAAGSSAGARP